MDGRVGETKQEILAAASAAGALVTPPQLARLHRAGAISEPQVRSLGRGRGRASLYPAGTAKQVVRLVELAPSERRLAERAWLAWWLDGGAMSDAAQNYLVESAAELEAVLETVRALQRGEVVEIDGRQATVDDLYQAAERERLSGVVGRARARTGKKRFSSVVAFLMQLSSGEFQAFPVDRLLGTSEPEQELIELALGLTGARREAIAGGRPWLEGDLEADFARLAIKMKRLSFVEQARESDVLLNVARLELRALTEVVASAANFLDSVFGRGAFSYRELADALTLRNYQDQAFALLAWSHMRHDRQLREGMTQVISLRGLARQMQSGLAEIEQLRKGVRALAPLLAHERLAAAMRDPSEMSRLQVALTAAREDHADKINAALNVHVASAEKRV